ncbi:autotransporter-associated beta strand repeat-containing protein [Saccharicrinis sp. FJH54]|uniref:rhamnogalacturonan lyase family protein n=1 Tax=Saccharicrinis sp. FJH54 TaxID=3344665 RepID=UPI0035D4201A
MNVKLLFKICIWVCAVLFSATQVVAQRQIEKLDRGVVAIRKSSSQVYVSWRWLGTESEDVAYNIYRGNTKLNDSPITNSTNYLDNTTTSESYSVAAVIDGVEQPKSDPVAVWSNTYKDIPLQVPAGGTTPDNVSYSYSPNDASVGDLDGDQQYEIILKWDPSNAKDNSNSGYTGNVYIDGYEMDGTFLWRVDLGKNIRAGAHYTQFMVYDFDGDGKAEFACKTAPGTKDGTGAYLSKGPAATDNDQADYRNSGGYILSGEEYLTIFNGETGAEMATVNYNPPRGNVSSWGDSYGNRVDRFLACVAYLDGVHPSLVMCRGYYTRMVLAAWDWDGTNLKQRWVFDTNNSGYSSWQHQGNHQVSVADVDFDGKDEIIYGSATIDDDGSGLYNTNLGHGDALHVSDFDPDRPGLEVFAVHENSVDGMTFRAAEDGRILFQIKAGFDNGRGVAGDIDPNYYGAEMWSGAGSGTYNVSKQMVGDKPSMNFLIWWDGDLSRELLDKDWNSNQGLGIGNITKYNEHSSDTRLLTANGTYSNNYTKGTPCLQADLFGDWREEVIWRTTDNKKLRIYTTPYPTDVKIRTLMHDPQYRLAIAWQNVAYNQPPHPGFYLGTGMKTPPLAPIVQADLTWDGTDGFDWNIASSANWKKKDGSSSVFNNDDDVLFSLTGNNSSAVNISESLEPKRVSVISPGDYIFSGAGQLAGDMDLIKSGTGTLIITNSNVYTGTTEISQGNLRLDGELSASKVLVDGNGVVSGTGIFGNGLELSGGSQFYAGHIGEAGTTSVAGGMQVSDDVTLNFDLSGDPDGTSGSNDSLKIDGDFVLNGKATVAVNKTDGELSEGTYVLISYTGSFTGDLNKVEVTGIRELLYELQIDNNKLVLVITKPRDPANLVWDGESSNAWDLLITSNWLNAGNSDIFVVNDHVLFDDTGNANVNVSDDVPIGNMEVNASQTYVFSGNGTISGPGGITKSGSGYLKIATKNKFTGPLVINSGYLDVTSVSNAGDPGGLGAATSDPANWIIDGGIFRYSGADASTNRGLTIGSNGAIIETAVSPLTLDGTITGAGSLTKRGGSVLKISAANSYQGGTVIEAGTLSLITDNANTNGLGSEKITLKSATLSMYDNNGSYTDFTNDIEVPATFSANWLLDGRCNIYSRLTGAGTLGVFVPYVRSQVDGDWSEFEGQINVTSDSDGGMLILNNGNGYGKASINLGDKVSVIRANSEDITLDVGELTGAPGSKLGAGGDGTNTITWRIGTKNSTFSFDGVICDDQYKNSGAKAALIKAGSGRMTLTNSNTYSGGTVVEKGGLIVSNSSGSGTGTGDVQVKSGAVLSGTGSVSGTVTVNAGGYLMAGIATTGSSILVNNNVTFLPGSFFLTTVNSDNGTCDKLRTTGTVNLAGTLYINNLGSAFKKGDSFIIIQSAGKTGEFAAVYPASPGAGLYWDLSGIKNSGILRVTDIPTSINDVSQPALSRVYPNPVSKTLYIDFNRSGKKAVVSVIDLSGRVVYYATDVNAKTLAVKFDTFPQGIYLVKIVADGKSEMTRIVKE